jgi:hypothetical protein
MGLGLKWTLIGGVIGTILIAIFAIIFFRVFNLASDFKLDQIIAVSATLIVTIFIFFWKLGSNLKKEQMNYLIGLISEKADREETELKISSIKEAINDHKLNDNQNYDRLFEFITSIDHKLDTLISKR